MQTAFPSAIGELSPALSEQTAKRLRKQINRADDKAVFWESMTIRSLVGGLVAAPAGGMLMLAVPLSMGALPIIPLALVGASLAMAASALVGGLRAKFLTNKAEKLQDKLAYIENSGALNGVSAAEKIDASGFVGRLSARREMTAAAVPAPAPKASRGNAARM